MCFDSFTETFFNALFQYQHFLMQVAWSISKNNV